MNISMNASGGFDASSIAQLRQKMFAKLDSNGDGSIDKKEMNTAGKAIGKSEAESEELFKAIDSDGGGKISEKENDAFASKIEEQLKGKFSQSKSTEVGSSDSTGTVKALLEMMEKIREKARQQGGEQTMQQLFEQLQAQQNTYSPDGSKGGADGSIAAVLTAKA